MDYLTQTTELFYQPNDLSPQQVENVVTSALDGMDDGELFLEYGHSEHYSFDDGQLKNASTDFSSGFGLRSIIGETAGYAHSAEISADSLSRASETVRSVKSGHNGVEDIHGTPKQPGKPLYIPDNPLNAYEVSQKIQLLQQIDTYIRKKESRVKQVSVSLGGEWQAVEIMRSDGKRVADLRPLVRLNVSVLVEKDGRVERGSYGFGGRYGYDGFFEASSWQHAADEALRQSLVNLESVALKAGQMDVVLGSGWPGVLLHEAIGHGLEGDFNRKQTSAFSSLMGERVAAEGVTIVDDGTLADKRGSLTIDDEGTPTNCTTLIEDGILTGYMQDRLNARLMGMALTGNGRRESYEHLPLPRMTNTYMLNGDKSPEEIISQVEDGLYAVNFGGGQVDITSGKFVFSASEAYRIENGKVKEPVKGATLIGNGPDCLTKIKAIGNDMALDDGIGTCGKDGQGVPVGVGQPSMLLAGLTVGGTEV